MSPRPVSGCVRRWPIRRSLKQFFRLDRLPAAVLGRVRRVVEADPAFRERLAGAVAPELVDDIGREWLQRDDGWEERVDGAGRGGGAPRAPTITRRPSCAAPSGAGRPPSRRHGAHGPSCSCRVTGSPSSSASSASTAGRTTAPRRRPPTVRDELTAARVAVRNANDRAESARSKLAAIERERDDARRRADEAEQQRDALLAARAEASGAGAGAGGDHRGASAGGVGSSARRPAAGAGGRAGGAARRAVALPGAIAHSPRASAEHLLRLCRRALVLVDGYNVAKLGWPALDLAGQRDRTLDAADDLARRFGTEMAVVFDGSDVIGAHSARRRLVRVRYSPAGVTADDVIRAEVGAADTSRAVVVVTNDGAVRRDVAAAGANTVSSDAVPRRRPALRPTVRSPPASQPRRRAYRVVRVRQRPRQSPAGDRRGHQLRRLRHATSGGWSARCRSFGAPRTC